MTKKKAVSTLLTGLLLVGCEDNNSFDFGGVAPPIGLAPPTAVNDTFTGLQNQPLVVAAAGVLANDNLNLGSISTFQQTSTQGGTVVLNQDGSFTYTPLNGFSGADTFTYTLANSGGSSMATVTINVPLNSPTAVNDSFTTSFNTALNQAAPGVLANDTPRGATIAAFQNPSTRGAAVAVGAGGNFTYTPVNGFFGDDTFTYRLQNASGNSTATVTVHVNGQQFFVDNTAAGGGNGSQAQPFNTLAAGVTAASAVNGGEVVVLQGDGTSNGLNNQVDMVNNMTIRAFNGNRPRLVGPIFLAHNTHLIGLQIAGSPSDGIGVGSIVSNVTIQNLLITDPGGHGIALADTMGDLRIENTTINNAFASGIILQETKPVSVFLTNNTIDSPQNNGIAFSAHGTANVNWTESGTKLRNTSTAGLGQGDGWNLDLSDNSVFNATHTNCVSNVTNGFGYELRATSNANVTVVMVGCNITGGVSRGVIIDSNTNADAKARFTNNTFLGNFAGAGFEAGPSDTATLCLRMNGNNSDGYRLGNNDVTATFKIENFGDATGSLFKTENTGTVNVLGGTITNVTIGSCGIP